MAEPFGESQLSMQMPVRIEWDVQAIVKKKPPRTLSPKCLCCAIPQHARAFYNLSCTRLGWPQSLPWHSLGLKIITALVDPKCPSQACSTKKTAATALLGKVIIQRALVRAGYDAAGGGRR